MQEELSDASSDSGGSMREQFMQNIQQRVDEYYMTSAHDTLVDAVPD